MVIGTFFMRAADDDASVSSLHADLFRFELNDIERHAKVVVVVEKLGENRSVRYFVVLADDAAVPNCSRGGIPWTQKLRWNEVT